MTKVTNVTKMTEVTNVMTVLTVTSVTPKGLASMFKTFFTLLLALWQDKLECLSQEGFFASLIFAS